MVTAIVIIAWVAYVWTLVQAAAALGSRLTVLALSAAAAALYTPAVIFERPLLALLGRAYEAIGLPLLVVNCAVMFGVGAGVPMLLRFAGRSRFLVAVIASLFALHLWSVDLRFRLRAPFVIPELWFAIGTAWYLVFKARIFEDEPVGEN